MRPVIRAPACVVSPSTRPFLVQHFRIFLLVLLSVLLPIRGAVAGGMLCAVGAAHTAATPLHHGQATADAHVHGADATMAMHMGHAEPLHHAEPAPPHAPADTATASLASACTLCAVFCGVTGLPSAAPSIAAPHALTAIAFPSFSAGPPSFLSDGPERPPRSI